MNVIRSNAPIVRGTPGADLIIGGAADQRIYGLGGNDEIRGGDGTDRIFGGAGRDTLRGDAGSDRVRGGRGSDELYGNRGNDTLSGNAGRDRLTGGIGDDHLYGGAGHRDALAGGMGIDILNGGPGNFDLLRGDAGPDYLDGGGGTGDTASFETSTPPGYDPADPESGVKVDLDDPVQWRNPNCGVYYPGRSSGGSRSEGGSGEDGLRRIDNVIGSGFDDEIGGNSSTNSVDGGPGSDAVDEAVEQASNIDGTSGAGPTTSVELHRSALGANTLYVRGTDGDDEISIRARGAQLQVASSTGGSQSLHVGRAGVDNIVITGGDGNDQLSVGGVSQRTSAIIDGGAGNDIIKGGSGDDTLEDGTGDDRLSGRGGDDGLLNAEGRDRLSGGAGNDLLVSSSIGEGNVLDGGAGVDNASWAQAGEQFSVRARIGGTASSPSGPSGTDRVDGSIDDLEGTELDDVLIGNGRANGMLGRGGADTYVGKGGNDNFSARNETRDRRIVGGAGDDSATIDPKDRGIPGLRHVEQAKASDEQYMCTE